MKLVPVALFVGEVSGAPPEARVRRRYRKKSLSSQVSCSVRPKDDDFVAERAEVVWCARGGATGVRLAVINPVTGQLGTRDRPASSPRYLVLGCSGAPEHPSTGASEHPSTGAPEHHGRMCAGRPCSRTATRIRRLPSGRRVIPGAVRWRGIRHRPMTADPLTRGRGVDEERRHAREAIAQQQDALGQVRQPASGPCPRRSTVASDAGGPRRVPPECEQHPDGDRGARGAATARPRVRGGRGDRRRVGQAVWRAVERGEAPAAPARLARPAGASPPGAAPAAADRPRPPTAIGSAGRTRPCRPRAPRTTRHRARPTCRRPAAPGPSRLAAAA